MQRVRAVESKGSWVLCVCFWGCLCLLALLKFGILVQEVVQVLCYSLVLPSAAWQLVSSPGPAFLSLLAWHGCEKPGVSPWESSISSQPQCKAEHLIGTARGLAAAASSHQAISASTAGDGASELVWLYSDWNQWESWSWGLVRKPAITTGGASNFLNCFSAVSLLLSWAVSRASTWRRGRGWRAGRLPPASSLTCTRAEHLR